MTRTLTWLTNAFPLWILLGSIAALGKPELVTWFVGPSIVWALAIIMLGMGLTITFADFREVFAMPRAGLIGVLCQFGIMPLLGWGVAELLGLADIDPHLAVGLILVACCPGGTASNVITYLARANVALSVLMTMASTFAAVLLTPWLTKWLAGTLVEIDAAGLCWSTVQVVLIPVLLGLLANRFIPKTSRRLSQVSPLISVIAIVLIVSSVIGQNREIILTAGWRLLLAPAMLHLGGFGLGYLVARLCRLPEESVRTVSIEVGMQNSGLGTVLATKHFPGSLAPAPCAISAVYHSLIGSVLAGVWRFYPAKTKS